MGSTTLLPDWILLTVTITATALSFLWAMFKLLGHPRHDYAPLRFFIAIMLVLGACTLAFFLLRQRPLIALIGGLLATLIAWAAGERLLPLMQHWEMLSGPEKVEHIVAAGPVKNAFVPAVTASLSLIALIGAIHS